MTGGTPAPWQIGWHSWRGDEDWEVIPQQYPLQMPTAWHFPRLRELSGLWGLVGGVWMGWHCSRPCCLL